MGEFDSIDKIRYLAGKSPAGSLLNLGIGDDCCLVESRGGDELALSTDTMVEGVHFNHRYFTWRQAAARAAAAAISDLAAMAATPVCMLAAASVPKTGGAQIIDALADGLLEAAERWGCPLAGGDLTGTTGPVTLTITVIGRCAAGAAVKRSGAVPDQEIWITGECGDPAALIDTLEEGCWECSALMAEVPEAARLSLLSPTPRLAEAAELLKLGPPTAMIDVSDGVAADLGHIIDESGVGAVLDADKLPVGGYARKRAAERELQPEHFFLYGGEDFQLLFTLDSGTIESPEAVLDCGTRITRIGRTTEQKGELYLRDRDGKLTGLEKSGFDHLE